MAVKGLKRFWFYISLFPYFVSRSVQSRMSYRADFILGVIASMLRQSLGFIFIWAVFRGIPEINGWNFNQMTFVYGMQAITLGINEFLFAGTWAVGGYIQEGSLDRLLLRPVGAMFSILSADVTLHGLGAAALGLALCILSLRRLHIEVTIGLVLYWIFSIACGALIYFSINMVCATTAFWITDSSAVMMLVQNVSEFSKYPVSIYKKWLQIFLTFVIPFAFTSTFPAAFILGLHREVIYWLGPVTAAVICVTIAYLFWRFALTKYQSAGG